MTDSTLTNGHLAPEAPAINFFNLVWCALALAVMIGVIASGNLWALVFLHIFAGGLWTGIDLFMGFVVGPILRRTPFETRRAVLTRLTPRTIFIMPVLSIVTGTTGWFLAKAMGYLDTPWPAYGWVAAALVIVTILTIQGIGLLLPTQIRVYRELRKPNPDPAHIAAISRNYFYLIASQGVLQVAIMVIMARFRMGL
ncbi:MAG TPA: hypothetical protein VGU72_20490 [Beijerinckiaceae bacterium]|nr:hypothetical protein [Beijerinckiaceae bacterium]